MFNNALVVMSNDDKSSPKNFNPAEFWRHALIENKVRNVELADIESDIGLNKLYLNKVSHHFLRRLLFDAFKKAEDNFMKLLDNNDFDLILFHKGQYVRKELLERIRKKHTDIKLINFFPDNVFHYPHTYLAISHYDYFFLKDTYLLAELHKSGYYNCHYLPMAFSAKYHRMIDQSEITNKERKHLSADVSFIGSIYPQRQRILENLEGYNLKIWGGSVWDSVDHDSWILRYHMNEIVEGEKKSKIIACSKININTHHFQNDIFGTNNRLHEITACGGFQLVDYKKDLEDQYILEKEISVYRDSKEMRQKIQYYLDNPKEREKIAKAGHKRALRDHSYTKRIESAFKIIKKKQD